MKDPKLGSKNYRIKFPKTNVLFSKACNNCQNWCICSQKLITVYGSNKPGHMDLWAVFYRNFWTKGILMSMFLILFFSCVRPSLMKNVNVGKK